MERSRWTCESTPFATVSVPSTQLSVKAIWCPFEIDLNGGIGTTRFPSRYVRSVSLCGSLQGFVDKNNIWNLADC